MKKISVLLFAILLIQTSSYADVQYSYDASGNRIKKEIVLNTKQSIQTVDENIKPASEMLSERNIKIFPNPTHGILKIEINPLEKEDNSIIAVSKMSGQLLIQFDNVESSTEMDLSQYANGLYLLQIVINGENSVWKIIKE